MGILFNVHRAPAPAPVEFLIVGLGNPGKEYAKTRHNAGYMAVERVADALGAKIDRTRFNSLCGRASLCGHGILLMKPVTFMNLSGSAVQEAARFYKTDPGHIFVFSDDISLDTGRLRVRRKGSDGGHNGLKSIISLLGSSDFPRAKIGVGKKPDPDYDLAKWVLSPFGREEMASLEKALDCVYDIITLYVKDNLDEAMNRYNGR